MPKKRIQIDEEKNQIHQHVDEASHQSNGSTSVRNSKRPNSQEFAPDDTEGWALGQEPDTKERKPRKSFLQRVRKTLASPLRLLSMGIGLALVSFFIPPLVIPAVACLIGAAVSGIIRAIQSRRENLMKGSSSAPLHATHDGGALNVIGPRDAMISEVADKVDTTTRDRREDKANQSGLSSSSHTPGNNS